MHRYFIHFSYDGTGYHGWQIQPNGISVQEVLQQALSVVLRREMTVTGAGRTDTGVHARRMTAHFDIDDTTDCAQLTYKLNRLLPRDVAVENIEEVAPDLHARFSACRRTYHYYIHFAKNPFKERYSSELHFPLDFNRMNEAAGLLLQTNDFAAFCKSHTDVKTTFCNVTEAVWIRQTADEWYFRISADRFLRNMVRAVVGTLIDVGRGRLSTDDFRAIIETKRRTAAGESMPAKGLFLEEIEYEHVFRPLKTIKEKETDR